MNDLPEVFVIGRPYHLSWARNRGMSWILKSFDQDKDIAHLVTPHTRKPLQTKLSALRDVNKTIAEKEKINKPCK